MSTQDLGMICKDTTPCADGPGPGLLSIVGFGFGAAFGLFFMLFSLDFAGFELGKHIGRMQAEHRIDQAVNEAEMFQRTGYYNLRETIDAFEQFSVATPFSSGRGQGAFFFLFERATFAAARAF